MTFCKMLALMAATTSLAGPAIAEQAQSTPNFAQSLIAAQEDAEVRIQTSVKIKLRAQSVSAAACHLHMGMNPDALRTPMNTQIAEFDQFVTALTAGDLSLRISAPDNSRKTRLAAQRVAEAWTPVKAAAFNIASGQGQAADTDLILTDNLDILEHGHNFTAELVQQFANPAESTLADLFTIVIATRQGMLSQKMSKESCMVTYAEGSSEKLRETMGVFENTLFALRDGMPGTGIAAAPTEDIKTGLGEAIETWNAVKPLLQQIKSGEEVSPDIHAAKMRKLDDLKLKMLDVSELYVEYMQNKRS